MNKISQQVEDLFGKQERWLEAQRILIWEMELRRRLESLEEGNDQ